MIRLGLIGCGVWGRNYIAAAEESGAAKVVHVATHNWRRTELTTLDGVIVATPPEPRAEIVIELASRGIPMMVEKPLCLSFREAFDIQEALAKRNALFLVDYVHLFAPAYEELRDRVRALLGRVRCYGHSSASTRRDYGLLWDHTPHDLAMCLGLGGGAVAKVSTQRTADDSVELNVEFVENVDGRIRASYGAHRREFAVICTGRGFAYDGSGSLMIDGVPKLFTEKPLTRAVRAFAGAVKAGGTNDWRFGIGSSIVITKILEDAQPASGVADIARPA